MVSDLGFVAALSDVKGCTVASCIRDWLDDGLMTRQASTVENYRRLADHAIGKLGAVKLKDPDGPAGAEGPGRAVGIAVDPLAAAAGS
jgi:hypothetical protein